MRDKRKTIRTIVLPLLGTVIAIAALWLALPTQGQAGRVDSLPTPWQARISTAPYPGIWHFQDLDLAAPHYPNLVGTHRVWAWDEIEPAPGVYRWDQVEHWVSEAAAGRRPVGLGINTYDGVYDGGDRTPRWVYGVYPDAEIVCANGWTIPKYWHPGWQAALDQLIADFAAHFDGDPRVAWVEISVGVYGETTPESVLSYRTGCLQKAGLTSSLWVKTVNAITDIYVRHFKHTQLFLQMAPAFLKFGERREFVNYAAAKGVGLKHNGLQADQGTAVYGPCPDAGSDCEAGFVELMRKWGDRVPIAWEGDPRYFRPGLHVDPNHPEWAVYWQILNALDKHSDYILYNQWLAQYPADQPLFAWANQYLGRTVHDALSAWVVLRETALAAVRHPQYGNYSYWLYQEDAVPGGRSVPMWNVGPYPEGYYARRTDQDTGNPYLYFNVDDAFFFNGNGTDVRVRVTYLDRGRDTWSLEYDAAGGLRRAGTVVKEDTGTWRVHEFLLPDARFANGLPGGMDFRIDSNQDGDEIIHKVDVLRSLAATPTPTPTWARPFPPTATPTPGPPLHEIKLQEGRYGYTGVQDAYISKTYPNVNFGTGPLSICPVCPGNAAESRRVLIRFDNLSSHLPSNAHIEYAWLDLYSLDGSNNLYVRAYPLLRPWVEDQVTWNQAASGSPWARPGADGIGTDRGDHWSDQGTTQDVDRWMPIDVTEHVREWRWHPATNFGVVLIPFYQGAAQYTFASSEYGDPSKRPTLRIGYTIPGEPPPSLSSPTPSPTPTATSTPTVTPTPSPAPVLWIVQGRLYDAQQGPSAPIASGVITVTLGTGGPQLSTRTNENGAFFLSAQGPDRGELSYVARAKGYHERRGTEPKRSPRTYTLYLGLEPVLRPRAYLPFLAWSH